MRLSMLLGVAVCAAAHAEAITSIGTTTVNGTESTPTGSPARYNNTQVRLNSVTTASGTYNRVAPANASVIVYRSGGVGATPITATWNYVATPAAGATLSLDEGSYAYNGTTDTAVNALQLNSIRQGLENTFIPGDGSGTGATTNIIRIDFLFPSGIAKSSDVGFAVLERGANGQFSIAAITSPGGGTYSSAINVTDGYSAVDLDPVTASSTNGYDVFQTTATSQNLSNRINQDIGPQVLAGRFFHASEFTDAGATIYGYSLFMTGTGSDADFSSIGIAYFAVPEPATFLLAGLGGSAIVWLRRRRAAA